MCLIQQGSPGLTGEGQWFRLVAAGMACAWSSGETQAWQVRASGSGWSLLGWHVPDPAGKPRLVHSTVLQDLKTKSIMEPWLRARSVALLPYSCRTGHSTGQSGFSVEKWTLPLDERSCRVTLHRGCMWAAWAIVVFLPLQHAVLSFASCVYGKLPHGLKTVARGVLEKNSLAEESNIFHLSWRHFILLLYSEYLWGWRHSRNGIERMLDEAKLFWKQLIPFFLFIYAMLEGILNLCFLV